MAATREQISAVLRSADFTSAEKFVVRAQYRHTYPIGNFEEQLWNVLTAADSNNLTRLAMGFPDEAAAVMAWQSGTLGNRLREAGLSI